MVIDKEKFNATLREAYHLNGPAEVNLYRGEVVKRAGLHYVSITAQGYEESVAELVDALTQRGLGVVVSLHNGTALSRILPLVRKPVSSMSITTEGGWSSISIAQWAPSSYK